MHDPVMLGLGPFSWLELALMVALAAVAFAFWRLTRHQECGFVGEAGPDITGGLRAMAGSTHGHLIEGNAVTLIQNEAFFDEIEQAIDAAEKTVHFETFLWHADEAGERVTRMLERAARRGVTVRVLIDASGSGKLPVKNDKRLEEAGARVCRFHRWRLATLGRLNIRDHRKILVVDGRLAFVGGHCVSNNWLKDEPDFPRFRDITARIRGPLVAKVQSCFFENWTERSGEVFVDETTFPELEPEGEVTGHVAYVRCDQTPAAVQVLHHLAVGYARKRIWIQNPYFMPDRRGADMLIHAAKRGVEVRLMVPDLTATDSPVVSRAGRRHFTELLNAGVKIYLYQKTLLHQKVLTVDGLWAAVGSSNFDDRSFEINDEITIGYADERIARELEETFERDLEECKVVDLDWWKGRPLKEKVLTRVLSVFGEQF
ncbi:phospholipase D-like domain-containing protein [Haloferula sargassicola]|uniref:Cardiolipin synthase A n=1 Tax=Haloferula sargassicola TaxID=490096 RepID=A0ABP9UIM1_9BACT